MRTIPWTKVMCVAAAMVVAGCLPAHRALAEHAGAVSARESVTQMSPGKVQARDREGEIPVAMLLADGRYIAVIDAVKEMASPSAVLLNEEGVAYEHLGGYDNARVCYEESIKLDPKNSNVYNNLGTIYHARHNLTMAMKLYRKAIKLDSKSASAYKNLGAAYFLKGNTRRGAEAFEDALTIDPGVLDRQGLVTGSEDAGTLVTMDYFLAQLCAKSGRTDAAIAYLNRAIAEGFTDYAKLRKDDAFASVRRMPEFPTRAAQR
jgi:tetratricopeptide (TPR) repeat protein